MISLIPPHLLVVLSIIVIAAIAAGAYAFYEHRYERSRHELHDR